MPHCAEEIRYLHCDDALLVVSKPAGLLSVPGRHPSNKDCLISRINLEYPCASIVHRLDMATSGLMIIARNPESHRAISRLFQDRKIHKEYQAIVFGHVISKEGFIDLPLACDWPNRPRQELNFDYGKHAQTHYEYCGQHNDGNSKLRLIPITGRSHQLRVHTASIGHPILGCEFYAHPAAKAAADRLLLHASRLRFTHPITNNELDITLDASFWD
ncbi:Ribosomal large subunit pseudouridine synthase A [Zhongshania aliphaticivorans]|uniref:Dual-specificity RNA pseudouridine synthase RluA n=1 Tax=Zhongshania aliphaticivorans TaxID=1470434 RepID=A0A5S9NTL6_9GAMM|nr:Ribosomal large subunit pseudouridine synthase A [Zhongshania aliphaticivorans]CAA0112057.1 Ribosomal large subunit pseudouridine synthase A [Zhongshania aliphaticivorans]